MSTYIPRYIDAWLDEYMPHLPAIAIEGAKGVGKTQTAQRRAKTVFRLDQKGERESMGAGFERLYDSSGPIFIDEWQHLPEVWDRVRRMVDDKVQDSCILLAGSQQSTDLSLHSGAGRIVRKRMRPLSMAERFQPPQKINLHDCFAGTVKDKVHLESTVTYTDYMSEVVRTGFPAIRDSDDKARSYLIDAYIENIATREFAAQGIKLRQPQALIAWMKAYAAAVGTTTSYTKILDAATPGEDDKPSKKTTIGYREALASMWLIDDLSIWYEGEDFFGRLKQTPKHFLADPGLEARLLGINQDTLSRGLEKTIYDEEYGSIAGRLFESLCTMSVRTYASSMGAKVSFLRTADGGREVDMIVQKDQKVVAIEVKMSESVSGDDVNHLNWLKGKLGEKVSERIILTTGKWAYRRDDGVLVIPAALFG